MPPKPRITKEMILNTVLKITRQTGFEAVNARSIAENLNCSTRPIFTCYENMEELKRDFLQYSFKYYNQYVSEYRNNTDICDYLILPLSYIEFAKEETNLFKLLFISDMDLNMTEEKDFYKEPGNEDNAIAFSEMLGLSQDYGKTVFLDMFLYTHGIAVLTATGKLSFNNSNSENMLLKFVSTYTNCAKEKGGK